MMYGTQNNRISHYYSSYIICTIFFFFEILGIINPIQPPLCNRELMLKYILKINRVEGVVVR